MALIPCPECDKQISDKAKACPNCGFPVEEMEKPKNTEEVLLQFPELPNDLSIGKPITNWAGNTYFKGFYDAEENAVEEIDPGVVHVMMHNNGISISGAFHTNPYHIHNSQIISLKQISRTELGSINKDVIGRAAVGALIYGPAGAVIGALTAKKQHNQHYLIINYWDINSRNAQSLIIRGDKTLINTFAERHEEDGNWNDEETLDVSSTENALEMVIEQINSMNLKKPAEEYFNQGMEFIEKGEINDAILEFAKVIRKSTPREQYYESAKKNLKEMGFSESDIRQI